MRLTSAFILASALFFSGTALAVPVDPKPETRSPIEWFLSDLGSLFVTAVSSLEKLPKAEPNSSSDPFSVESGFEEDIFGDEIFYTAALPAAPGDAESTSTPDDKTSGLKAEHSETTDWLSDFFSFLQRAAEPQTVVTDEVAPSPPSSDTHAEIFDDFEFETATTASVREPFAEEGSNDLFSVLEQAAAAYEDDTSQSTEKLENKPTIGELFSSIGNFFSTLSDTASESETQLSETSTETKAHSPTEEPVQLTATSPADAETNVQTDDRLPEEEIDVTDIELAPWDLSPHQALFKPDAEVFDDTAPLIPAPRAAEVASVTAAELDEPAPVIRKRQSRSPAARNHLALGKPELNDVPDEDPGFFNHLIETFVGEDVDKEESSEVIANKISDRIVPEEKLDLGYVSPDAAQEDGPQDELTTIGDNILKHVDLYLGADTVIGRRYDVSNHKSGSCIERRLQVSVFCVSGIDWPAEIAESFAQDTAFTLPGEGVIRYENGRVSRAYTPFKASDFAEVVKFMQRRFGPPLEREVIWMHMIEAPKLPNTTFRWRAVSADRKDTVVLEVRNFDDLRRSFADLNRGMVRLYRDGSRPIFKHLSTMDLMLIQRRRVSQAPVTPDTGSAAN